MDEKTRQEWNNELKQITAQIKERDRVLRRGWEIVEQTYYLMDGDEVVGCHSSYRMLLHPKRDFGKDTAMRKYI